MVIENPKIFDNIRIIKRLSPFTHRKKNTNHPQSFKLTIAAPFSMEKYFCRRYFRGNTVYRFGWIILFSCFIRTKWCEKPSTFNLYKILAWKVYIYTGHLCSKTGEIGNVIKRTLDCKLETGRRSQQKAGENILCEHDISHWFLRLALASFDEL